MHPLKRIDKYRRLITRGVTKNIGSSKCKMGIVNDASEIKRMLIIRPNHRLGNLLLITPLLQEIEDTFPNCKTDVFVRGGLAPILFKNYTSVDTVIQLPKKPFKQLPQYLLKWISLGNKKYDIVFNVSKTSSSGRLSTRATRAKCKYFGDYTQAEHPDKTDYRHIAKFPVYDFREYITRLGLTANNGPVPTLNLKLSETELVHGKAILKDLVKNDKPNICIFTYATGHKCHAESWWEPFYALLLQLFPDYNIIEVLPKENVSQIGFKAPSFYSGDVREIGAVMANTSIFIGADSGIMHLAVSAGTLTLGLFSGNNISIYEPYGGNNMAIDTRKHTIEECAHKVKALLEM